MQGRVLDVLIHTNFGVISGDDGNRYSFTNAGWRTPSSPRQEMQVDFESDGNTATGIYAAPGSGAGALATSLVSSDAAPGELSKISTMGIIGMCASILAIVFFKSALFAFPLIVVGLGLSVAGRITGNRRGERVGFATAGIVLNLTPLVLNAIIATSVTLLANEATGKSGGIFKAIVKQILPFY